MDVQAPERDASGSPIDPPPAEEGGASTEASPAPADESAPPPQEISSSPEETPASSPPESPPPSSPPPPSSSPPPPDESSPTTPPTPSNSPPPSGRSKSPSPPPPSAAGGSPPSVSPPPPSPPAPEANSTPVTPSTPGIFAPPPPQTVPGAPGRTLPPPSEPRRTPSGGSPATPDGGSRSPPPSNSSSSSSNNTVLIAGVVIAGVVLIAFVAIWLLCSKKKKKQAYYMDPGRTPKGNEPYYNGTNNWNSPNPMDHVVKLAPPPGVMGTPATPGTAWGTTPQVNGSSEFSSGYSGLNQVSPNMGMGGFNQSQFRYEELAAATGGFSQANLLGQGGFGYVHKGVLSDGRTVAVKSLKTGSGQGEREFQAEVDIISRVHHRHLVSLVGYCIADGQRMLVYEFVPNKTLEFHLHGKGQPVMEWEFRVRIALGSAKGLAYLHEDCHPKIIHRDIKAANILLDDKYEAMVADFGLAKLSSDNYTHVSTRVMGTFGYLAPEYASSGKLSEKSDVFSFGVMLLELITGRRPVDPNDRYMEDSLVDWARPILTKALEDGDYSEIADPRLEGKYEHHEMARMIASASASIRHSARRRPKMSQIVRALEGDSSLEDLNDTNKQARSSGFMSSSGDTQTYDTGMYNADMSKFRQMVMDNPDNSSEFGATTSEFGLNPSSSSSDSRESLTSDQQKHKI
ncbi:OLC1v1010826C1 [Oldenlandia corymbosa var. corymbosa]|uniref:non-specific serine/threonine protein kinase n=1 Tax=Oldenlandia corymbosa var. corymbosa TaxID=529605 RepID=A0AAV1DS96_OLDCO|nr:OLC1v1010826C1 [Oldenlandia corymbosa var. corymbosa]